MSSAHHYVLENIKFSKIFCVPCVSWKRDHIKNELIVVAEKSVVVGIFFCSVGGGAAMRSGSSPQTVR